MLPGVLGELGGGDRRVQAGRTNATTSSPTAMFRRISTRRTTCPACRDTSRESAAAEDKPKIRLHRYEYILAVGDTDPRAPALFSPVSPAPFSQPQTVSVAAPAVMSAVSTSVALAASADSSVPVESPTHTAGQPGSPGPGGRMPLDSP